MPSPCTEAMRGSPGQGEQREWNQWKESAQCPAWSPELNKRWLNLVNRQGSIFPQLWELGEGNHGI